MCGIQVYAFLFSFFRMKLSFLFLFFFFFSFSFFLLLKNNNLRLLINSWYRGSISGNLIVIGTALLLSVKLFIFFFFHTLTVSPF